MGQPKAVEKRLQVAIDMGTTSTGVAYRLRGISDEIYVVQFNPGSNAQNPSLSKAIFYYRGDKLFWGEELQDMLANGTVAPGQVVRLAKLATYQNQETRNIRLTVRRQLKAVGKDLEKLFTDYYTSLVHRAIDAACARGVARHEIQQLPLDIFSCS